MPLYREKGEPFHAVQFWPKPRLRNVRAYVLEPDGLTVRPGQWILQDGHGKRKVMDDAEFRKRFDYGGDDDSEQDAELAQSADDAKLGTW